MEEVEGPVPAAKPGRKRAGRPPGSKNKKKTARKDPEADALNEELYQEAVAQLGDEGTTPEMQKKLANRFVPTPRPSTAPKKGIRAGTPQQVMGTPVDADTRISVEDGEVEGE